METSKVDGLSSMDPFPPPPITMIEIHVHSHYTIVTVVVSHTSSDSLDSTLHISILQLVINTVPGLVTVILCKCMHVSVTCCTLGKDVLVCCCGAVVSTF